MIHAARDVKPRDSAAIARLPIDRVFAMKGFGTVVTGTLVGGTIHREDELEVFPSGRRVRVRGIQVHGESAETAFAGQRSALNLAGASAADLTRGMTLVPPGLLASTRRADVSLRLLPSAARPLRNRARLHFHSYTLETAVEVVLNGKKQIVAGEQSLARIKLPEAALLLPGDRFILRQFSPVITIGGGIVLDAAPVPRMPALSDFLNALAQDNPDAAILARIARQRHHGLSIARLIAETAWSRLFLECRLEALIREHKVVAIGEIFLDVPALETLKAEIVSGITEFHRKNPLMRGLNKEELRSQSDTSPDVFDGVTALLIAEKKIQLMGDLVRLPGREVVMRDDEAESREIIESAFSSSGLQTPALQDVLTGLKIDKMRAQKIVTLLLREKLLIKISDQLVFHRSALDHLRKQIAAYKNKSLTIDVAQFKALTGVSRKYAIPLLEYLDRERVTKRVGDQRQLL
jgi:selenocysteine-specific elongation factor